MIFVALGGAIGATFRYLIGEYVNNISKTKFPIGILLINLMGAFVLGSIINQSSSNLYLFLATGFCGGFTTYSTFSIEAIQLLQRNQYGWFFTYIILTIIGSILAIFAGQSISP